MGVGPGKEDEFESHVSGVIDVQPVSDAGVIIRGVGSVEVTRDDSCGTPCLQLELGPAPVHSGSLGRYRLVRFLVEELDFQIPATEKSSGKGILMRWQNEDILARLVDVVRQNNPGSRTEEPFRL